MSHLALKDVDTAKRIRALLALRGETTLDLATQLGVSQPTVSYRLTGRRPFGNRCSLAQIATVLGVPVGTLTLGRPWPDVRN
jgi:transcriptional regulator with XRE-family HTH domain